MHLAITGLDSIALLLPSMGMNTDQTSLPSTGDATQGDTTQLQERILQLEELAAHQTKVIDELSDQLAEQWKVVEQTRAKLDRLTERFLTLEEQSLDAPAITRPPHY